MTTPADPAAPRVLGFGTCVLLGFTMIVGGGIFALPPLLATALAGFSPLAFVGAALVSAALGLMTAEAAGTTTETGGAYQYSRLAFGAPAGFVVAWIAWLNTVIAWSWISLSLVKLLDLSEPGLGSGTSGKLLATAEIAAFAVVNALGARPGAAVSNALAVAKLLPLALFVGLGALAFDPAKFGGGARALESAGAVGFAAAVYRCMFAASGFENIGAVAGEVANPKKTIPRAVLIAIVASSALYALVQLAALVCADDLPALAARRDATTPALPLAAEQGAARALGAGAARLAYGILLAGAAVSMLGFCAGVAVVSPRYLAAMAGDRFLPPALVRTNARGTPVAAILAAAAVAALLVWQADWLSLLDANVFFSFVQHAATVLAAWRLRKLVPREGRFVVPGGPAGPLAALGMLALLCWFAFQAPPQAAAGLYEPVSFVQVRALFLVVGAGLAVGILSRLFSRRAADPKIGA